MTEQNRELTRDAGKGPEVDVTIAATSGPSAIASRYQAISNSWSVLGQVFLQVRDGTMNTVTQSVSAVGSLGQEVINKTIASRWLNLSTVGASDLRFDERHFFLIPYPLASDGYSVATLRVLPQDVAPINDLPKRRFIHLPNLESEAMLKKILMDQSASLTKSEASAGPNSGVGQSLVGIADQLDQIDSQLFYGALALGTAIAIVNPVAGAIVAAKALAPSVLATLAKYGLRSAGSSLETSAVDSKVRAAQNDVIKQFSGSHVVRVVNPVLLKLSLAIRTHDHEFDPVFDESNDAERKVEKVEFAHERITGQAILSIYEDLIDKPQLHAAAKLGSEDIRWLIRLRDRFKSTT